MRTNRMDIVTDLIKKRMSLAFGVAHTQFKNTNPYRKERIPDEERIYDFAQLSDEDINFARQNFPPEVVNEYFGKMQDLIRRQNARTTMESL